LQTFGDWIQYLQGGGGTPTPDTDITVGEQLFGWTRERDRGCQNLP
jgi:hypothetical protein